MTTNRYIEFCWNEGTTYKFKVPMGGYKTSIVRNSTVSVGVDGSIDVTLGADQNRFRYLIVIRDAADEDAGYATLAQLKALFRRNNPNHASQSCRIPFKDHQGNAYTIVMVGNYEPEPQTTVLEGSSALYFIQLEMIGIA
jgi:hypothetical protein